MLATFQALLLPSGAVFSRLHSRFSVVGSGRWPSQLLLTHARTGAPLDHDADELLDAADGQIGLDLGGVGHERHRGAMDAADALENARGVRATAAGSHVPPMF